MTDAIKDAFLKGQAAKRSRDLSEEEYVTETIRGAKRLWDLMNNYADLAEQAGYRVGKLEGGQFKLIKDKPWYGTATVTWYADFGCRCRAQDEKGHYIHDFGSTPEEAAKNLMFYIGQDAIVVQSE